MRGRRPGRRSLKVTPLKEDLTLWSDCWSGRWRLYSLHSERARTKPLLLIKVLNKYKWMRRKVRLFSLSSLASFISLCQRLDTCFHGAVWKYRFPISSAWWGLGWEVEGRCSASRGRWQNTLRALPRYPWARHPDVGPAFARCVPSTWSRMG